MFETTHRLSGTEALVKLSEALQNYTVEGSPNLYVFQKGNVINLMRISLLGCRLTEEELDQAQRNGYATIRETDRLLVEI